MTLPPPISMMDWTPPPPLACSLTPIHAPTPCSATTITLHFNFMQLNEFLGKHVVRDLAVLG